GQVVEEATAEQLLSDPRHPYTWALLNAVPRLDRHVAGEKRLITIEGAPPDPANWPSGCRFRARCPFAVERCNEAPPLAPVGTGRLARCWVTQDGGTLPKPGAATRATPATVRSVAYTSSRAAGTRGEAILTVKDLVKHFPLPKDTFFGQRRVLRAVDGVDLTVN